MHTQTKNRARLPTRIAIHTRLKEILTEVAPGLFAYPPGMDDSTVGAEFGASKDSVCYVRRECFGDLRAGSAQFDAQAAQIAQLSAQIQQLNGIVRQLIDKNIALDQLLEEVRLKHDTVCTHLSLNRVADVRHLVVGHKDKPE